MEEEALKKLSSFMEENKGKRKFVQSVELAINFTGIDFSKQDNRMNIPVRLPNGKGKEQKVAVFADDAGITEKASKLGALVLRSDQLQEYASSPSKSNELLAYELLAQPSLMPQIAKALGQFLGPRGKMPKPLLGSDISGVIDDVLKSVYIRNKGKYLPTIHCAVGTEKMQPSEVSANIDQVMNAVIRKVGRQHIKSVFVKLTMSKPLQLV